MKKYAYAKLDVVHSVAKTEMNYILCIYFFSPFKATNIAEFPTFISQTCVEVQTVLWYIAHFIDTVIVSLNS